MAIRQSTIRKYTSFLDMAKKKGYFEEAECVNSEITKTFGNSLYKLGLADKAGGGRFIIIGSHTSEYMARKVSEYNSNQTKRRIARKKQDHELTLLKVKAVESLPQLNFEYPDDRVKSFTDQQLISEIKERGYKVSKVTVVEL